MKDISTAAKERIKADHRRGAWWFGLCILIALGSWVLRKLDLLDIKTQDLKEWVVVPLALSLFYLLKAEVRKLIQEELHDESID